MDPKDKNQAPAKDRSAEDKYRGFFENAIEGIFQCTPEGRFVSANPAMARILGYESPEDLKASDELLGENFSGDAWREELLERLASQGRTSDFETAFTDREGHRRWGAINAWSVLGEGEKLAFIEGTFEDITQRKENEALRRARMRQEVASKPETIFWSP